MPASVFGRFSGRRALSRLSCNICRLEKGIAAVRPDLAALEIGYGISAGSAPPAPARLI